MHSSPEERAGQRQQAKGSGARGSSAGREPGLLQLSEEEVALQHRSGQAKPETPHTEASPAENRFLEHKGGEREAGKGKTKVALSPVLCIFSIIIFSSHTRNR